MACLKCPAEYNAGEIMKGIGKTGPNGSSVSMVKVLVLCNIPSPVYLMAAEAGIVIKIDWFAGIAWMVLKVKVDVLATQTAPANTRP